MSEAQKWLPVAEAAGGYAQFFWQAQNNLCQYFFLCVFPVGQLYVITALGDNICITTSILPLIMQSFGIFLDVQVHKHSYLVSTTKDG